MYGTTSYFLSKTISELPFQFFFPLLGAAISYFMVGLQSSAANFFTFYACLLLVTNVGQSIGMVTACAFANAEAAIAVTPV